MVAAAIVSLITGILLTHLIEPGVGVEKAILAGYTPTIHLFPKTSEPHPVAFTRPWGHGIKRNHVSFWRSTGCGRI
jgi:hypothetical protein